MARWPRLVAGAGLACLLCAASQGCTDGTTPDCSGDASPCRLVSVIEAGQDGDIASDAAEDAGNSEETGVSPEASPEAAASVPDGGDAASAGDAGDGGDAH